jgi:hypothetical protein
MPELEEIPIDLSDEEADLLLRAACKENEDAWIEQFGKILTKNGKILTLELNYLQEQVCDSIRWCRENKYPCRVIILKPRQKGSSTVTTACLYHMLQRRQTNGLIIGGEFSQTDNLWKITRRYADYDKMKWDQEQARITNERGFFGNGSILEKETAQDSEAGRSGTFHFVLATEIGRWKDTPARDSSEILTGVMACVPDLPDTAVVLESTAQGPSGVFYDRWNDADDWDHVKMLKAGQWKGRWIRVFAPWYAFDDAIDPLTRVQSESLRRSLTATEKELMSRYSCVNKSGVKMQPTLGHISWRRKILESECDGDETKFDREFPTTPQHAFRASSRARFDRDGLEWQRKNASAKDPLYGTLELSQNGKVVSWMQAPQDEAIFHVWEKPRDGYHYIISSDLMTGQSQVSGKDPDMHSVLVWRKGYFDRDRGWIPPALAARIIPECRWDIDVLAEWSWRLSLWYGKCLLVSEINCDRGFIELIRAKGDVPLYQREIFNHVNQKRSKAFGWHTSSSTRLQIEETLARNIRSYGEDGGGVHMNCLHLVGELESFCINKKGRAEALKGSHDDDVMSAGIGLCCVEQATRYRNRIQDLPLPRDLRELDKGNSPRRGSGLMGRRGFY